LDVLRIWLFFTLKAPPDEIIHPEERRLVS